MKHMAIGECCHEWCYSLARNPHDGEPTFHSTRGSLSMLGATLRKEATAFDQQGSQVM